MHSRCLYLAPVLLAVLALAACSPSQQSSPNNSKQAQAVNQRAQQDLKLYQQMREQGKYNLAAPIGHGVLNRAPDSKAAATIKETLEETQAKADAINKKQRLTNLWLYQSGEQSGGWQTTATIYPSRPVQYNRRIKLILRKHTDWGTSVYLYDTDDKGFVCAPSCKLALKVDGEEAKPLRASPPPTGEPSVFIDSQKRILKLLKTADTLTISIQVKGDGKQDLYFEVGGFQPDQWPEPHAPKPDEDEDDAGE